MARRGTDDLPAPAGRPLPGAPHRQPLLTQKRSDGTCLSPPPVAGRARDRVLQREEFLLRDLYLADAETGRVKRRLVKSTLNSNYESLRFINSAGSFSPDGRYFAIAAKRRDRDDLVILDVKKDEESAASACR